MNDRVSLELVHPNFECITTPMEFELYEKRCEEAARTCYKSEDKMGPGSEEAIIRRCINKGHESVLEHCVITVRMFGSRTFSHQLVRHRIAAYSQESQRYCEYARKACLKVVPPEPVLQHLIRQGRGLLGRLEPWEISLEEALSGEFTLGDEVVDSWLYHTFQSYLGYRDARLKGWTAEDAREYLPNCTKTEVFTTYNLRQWRWFFEKRCDRHAQAQIRFIAMGCLAMFNNFLPLVFGDLHQKFLVDAK